MHQGRRKLTHAGETKSTLRGRQLLPRRLLKADLVDHSRELVPETIDFQSVAEGVTGDAKPHIGLRLQQENFRKERFFYAVKTISLSRHPWRRIEFLAHPTSVLE